MATDLMHRIAEAYRWQRRLGNSHIVVPGCCLVVDPAHPEVWDSNHADDVTARTDAEVDAVFAAMNRHLGHTPWRVIHTDCFTPEAFLARLAFDDFEECPVTIQMALQGDLTDRGPPIQLRPVIDGGDWNALLRLVLADHAEGQRTSNSKVPPEVSADIVAGYRSKSGTYHFNLATQNGVPVAYAAHAAAPNGVGMIEDLFTLPSARRQGIASAIIAAFTDRLRVAGCHTVFLGALATEQPKRLYAQLGFSPVMLARTWARKLPNMR
ncbi:MAG: GNAT family N-acetyltransferase [Reyranellaceae bacterium]